MQISVLAGDFLLSRACVALASLKNTEVYHRLRYLLNSHPCQDLFVPLIIRAIFLCVLRISAIHYTVPSGIQGGPLVTLWMCAPAGENFLIY